MGYHHSWRRLERDVYEISWTYDRHYSGCRLRFPQTVRRTTDIAGVKRFCKKWGLIFNED